MAGAVASSADTGSRVLDDLVEIIGEEATFALASEFRGLRLYVPKDHTSNPLIADTIGEAAARQLCDALYDTRIILPYRVVLHRLVLQLAAQQPPITKSDIARRLKIREAQVYAILAKERARIANDRQFTLI